MAANEVIITQLKGKKSPLNTNLVENQAERNRDKSLIKRRQ